jgi:pyruvate/2-oxoglutarate dehydrogenase complex dihydrolipoamide dehydrogenase (E3) component
MSGGKSQAARYRRCAQQCLEMASVFQDSEARVTLLEMARIWQRLADQHREQPIMQQQEQIQPNSGKEE